MCTDIHRFYNTHFVWNFSISFKKKVHLKKENTVLKMDIMHKCSRGIKGRNKAVNYFFESKMFWDPRHNRGEPVDYLGGLHYFMSILCSGCYGYTEEWEAYRSDKLVRDAKLTHKNILTPSESCASQSTAQLIFAVARPSSSAFSYSSK